MTNMQSREEYSDDNYSESSEDIIEEKQRSVNLEELKDWELQNIIKMSTPTVKKVPDSVANLPLRFGRNFQEERSIKPAANLPLRFGRASAGSHLRHPLPFSHRFERAPFVQSSFHNLPQRFGRSRPFNLPQQTQDYDQDKKNVEVKKIIIAKYVKPQADTRQLLKMEVHPGMFFYNDVQDGTALLTKTLESTNHLTPLHIPPGPPMSPDRYEELRETFQLCKPALKAGQETGGNEPMLPESHRNYEPPYKINHEHHYYGNTRDAPLRLPNLAENSAEYVKYTKYKTPGTFLVESRYRPFHPYVHRNVVIRGSPSRNEDASEPFAIDREVVGPGQQGSFSISEFAEGSGQTCDPNASAGVPKSTFKSPELDISYRAANMLENVKKALWLSTYKRDYTGRGSMNPLLLDDHDAKIIGRATGELGKEVELRESFPSATSQVRPLDGRIARALQGTQFPISEPQQQESSDVHQPLLLCTVNSVTPRYSEGPQSNGKMLLSSFQPCPGTESGARRRDEYLLQNQIQPQLDVQGENHQEKKLPRNRFRKITDTWKMEHLYQRQLAVPPDREPTLKPADSIYYEDLQPSRLNRYIVWHNPVSLSKPTSTHLCFEKITDIPAIQFASTPKEIVASSPSPEWIPNRGVPRPQMKLLDIQGSFRKWEAIKRLNGLTKGGMRDLRDHNREGRRQIPGHQ